MTTEKFEAILDTDVRIKVPGMEQQLQLVLMDGSVLQVRGDVHVRRLSLRFKRYFRVRLRLRTSLNGSLRESLFLTQAEPVVQPLQHVTRTFWSARGLMADAPQTLLVFPQRTSAWPLRVVFRAPADLAMAWTPGGSAQVQGIIQHGAVVATSFSMLEPISLSERERHLMAGATYVERHAFQVTTHRVLCTRGR